MPKDDMVFSFRLKNATFTDNVIGISIFSFLSEKIERFLTELGLKNVLNPYKEVQDILRILRVLP